MACKKEIQENMISNGNDFHNSPVSSPDGRDRETDRGIDITQEENGSDDITQEENGWDGETDRGIDITHEENGRDVETDRGIDRTQEENGRDGETDRELMERLRMPTKSVPELLNDNDYDKWKVCTESYFRSRDLWHDVIIGRPERQDRSWQMRDAEALHAILISCGSTYFDKIKNYRRSREAWDHLAKMVRVRESDSTEKDLPILNEVNLRANWTRWKVKIGDIISSNSGDALKKIRESCGAELLSYIDKLESAEAAWDQLFTMDKMEMQFTSHTWCPKFYQALLNGESECVKKFLDECPGAMGARITKSWDTPLHIAAQLGDEELVKNLLSWMHNADAAEEIVKSKNKDGRTAFSIAAAGGNTMMALSILEKNYDLFWIGNGNNQIPVTEAAITGQKEMVYFLFPSFRFEYCENNFKIERKEAATLLTSLIAADIFDLALDLLRCNQKLAVTLDGNSETALNALAKNPHAFPSGSKLGTVGGFISNFIKLDPKKDREGCTIPGIQSLKGPVKLYTNIRSTNLRNKQAKEILTSVVKTISASTVPLEVDCALRRAIVQASQFGTVEVIEEIKNSCLYLLVNTFDEQRRSLFHVAIVHRQKKVFKIIHKMGALKEQLANLVDSSGNSMLHLAAMLSPYQKLEKVPTPALRVQYDLRWLKEVEKIVHPKWKNATNSDDMTPPHIFDATHKDMIQEGVKWVTGLANSSIIMATLITTVMFAAAFTLPGGNDNNTGMPVFFKDTGFMVFAISDAISLFSSISSVSMFLGIVTSRYAADDFLNVLPRKLIAGLLLLFIAVLSMLAAFGATLYIILHHRIGWIRIPIIILSACPIFISVIYQLSDCRVLLCHTYFSRIMN